ncbi:hypothetical protein AN958_04584 [Leucoagaricus sp. SymC.cos]|nr:hypothetical protein AN958_04584 [Leucoagaricus sp. SymC.cos]
MDSQSDPPQHGEQTQAALALLKEPFRSYSQVTEYREFDKELRKSDKVKERLKKVMANPGRSVTPLSDSDSDLELNASHDHRHRSHSYLATVLVQGPTAALTTVLTRDQLAAPIIPINTVLQIHALVLAIVIQVANGDTVLLLPLARDRDTLEIQGEDLTNKQNLSLGRSGLSEEARDAISEASAEALEILGNDAFMEVSKALSQLEHDFGSLQEDYQDLCSELKKSRSSRQPSAYPSITSDAQTDTPMEGTGVPFVTVQLPSGHSILRFPPLDPPKPQLNGAPASIYWTRPIWHPSGTPKPPNSSFLIDHYGKALPEDKKRQIRKGVQKIVEATAEILEFHSQWTHRSQMFQDHIKVSAELQYLELALCADHWKVVRLMTENFSGWIKMCKKRSGGKNLSPTDSSYDVKLERDSVEPEIASSLSPQDPPAQSQFAASLATSFKPTA